MTRLQGIRGLRWSNVGWIAFFSCILIMSVTADGYLKLNYSLITQSWKTLSTGGKNLWISQGKFARDLDKATAKRYGYDPLEPRAQFCVTPPNPAVPLTPTELGALRYANSREQLISTFGGAYCQLISGADAWLVGSSKVLRVEYKPGFNAQVLEIKNLSQADRKPEKLPKNAATDNHKHEKE